MFFVIIDDIDVGMNVEDEPVDLDRTLEEIHPFAKALPRQTSGRGRKQGKSAIMTSDCEMEASRQEQADRAEKKKGWRKKRRNEKKIKGKIKRKRKGKKSRKR